MSQTRKTLKKIASTDQYQALATAVKEDDYETIVSSYIKLSQLLEEAEREIEGKIQSLPRRNKGEDYKRFRTAFAARIRMVLPQWYWVDSELRERGVVEGEVFGFGSKGDPLVKTAEGRVVAIKGAMLKEGEKVRFRVATKGEKIDYGRVFELTANSFYQILNQEAREGIRDSLASLRERVESHLQGTDGGDLCQLSELLKELEEVRELTLKLKAEERESVTARLVAFRKRLLKASFVKLVFEFLSQQEEREIEESCGGNEAIIARALSAPGLFCHQAHETLKAEILSDEKPTGYLEAVNKLERGLDSMDSALKLLDFEANIEQVYPMAKIYLERIDRLFGRLSRRAMEVALSVAEDRVYDMDDIQSTIADTFSGQALSSELHRVFRSPEESFASRAALVKLRARLGNTESTSAEEVVKPYLNGFFQ